MSWPFSGHDAVAQGRNRWDRRLDPHHGEVLSSGSLGYRGSDVAWKWFDGKHRIDFAPGEKGSCRAFGGAEIGAEPIGPGDGSFRSVSPREDRGRVGLLCGRACSRKRHCEGGTVMSNRSNKQTHSPGPKTRRVVVIGDDGNARRGFDYSRELVAWRCDRRGCFVPRGNLVPEKNRMEETSGIDLRHTRQRKVAIGDHARRGAHGDHEAAGAPGRV